VSVAFVLQDRQNEWDGYFTFHAAGTQSNHVFTENSFSLGLPRHSLGGAGRFAFATAHFIFHHFPAADRRRKKRPVAAAGDVANSDGGPKAACTITPAA